MNSGLQHEIVSVEPARPEYCAEAHSPARLRRLTYRFIGRTYDGRHIPTVFHCNDLSRRRLRGPGSRRALRRLGGNDGVKVIADTLVDRVAADPLTGPSFRVPTSNRIKTALAEQICDLSGGPCRYSGDSMKQVHEGHHITQAQFYRVVATLRGVLRERHVDQRSTNELLRLLAPTKRDVVEPPGGQGGPGQAAAGGHREFQRGPHMNPQSCCAWLGLAFLAVAQAASAGTVSVNVKTTSGTAAEDTVVVLDPLDAVPPPSSHERAVIDQLHKTFVPRVSVIRTGTVVALPNSDSIRHEVYSHSPPHPFKSSCTPRRIPRT